MKQINYAGAEGESIVINKPTDIYPLLDWCQSRMIENQEEEPTDLNKKKWQNAIEFLNDLMEQTEKAGFGNFGDIDNIESS